MNEPQLVVERPDVELKPRYSSWICDTCGVTKQAASKTDEVYSSRDAANENASPQQSTQTQRTSSESSSDDFYSIEQDEDEDKHEVKTIGYPANGTVVLREYFQIVTRIYHNCNSFARLVKD